MRSLLAAPLARVAFVAALTLLPTSLAAASPGDDELAASGMGWSLRQLDLDVEVDPARPGFRVRGTARVVLDGLDASFGPSLAVNTRRPLMRFLETPVPEGLQATRDVEVPGVRSIRLLELRAAEPFARGAELELPFDVATLGSLEGSAAQQVVVGSGGALASYLEGWYPVPIPRLDRGEAFSSRIASAPGRTRLHLPPGWSALATGERVERAETADGVVEVWETSRPAARSFASAPFTETTHEVDGRTLRILLTSPVPAGEAEKQARMLAASIEAMSAYFGPYPAASFGIAEVPDQVAAFGWEASSEPGFLMARTGLLAVPGGNLALLAHEAAHGWWGNHLDPDGPGALVLSEALAQYGAFLAIEDLEGREAGVDFLDHSRAGFIAAHCAAGYFDIVRRGEDRALATLEGGGVEHSIAYAKGHWVHRMLRRRVGDERYFATLRALLDRADEVSTLPAFRTAFEEAAPDAGLPRFFADWLDRPGAPELDVAWSVTEGGVDLVVRQLQAGGPFELRVPFDVVAGGVTSRHELELEGEVTRVSWPVDGSVTDVVLDPDHELLLWRPEYGPAPSTTGGGG